MAVLEHARRESGASLPLVLAGFSFGTFVQRSRRAALSPQRMVLVGPAVGRFDVGRAPEDTIVIHGEQDEIRAASPTCSRGRARRSCR